jgi:hypothetical protein
MGACRRASLVPGSPTVGAENPIHGSDQQSCPFGAPGVMISDHVPAVHLPPDHLRGLMAAAGLPSGDIEDRRDSDPAPSARHPAAPSAMPSEAQLGGPGPARNPGQRDTQRPPPGPAASGHPGYDPALASRHSPPPLGRPSDARQERPATRQNIRALVLRWSARTPNGGTAGSTASWPAWE